MSTPFAFDGTVVLVTFNSRRSLPSCLASLATCLPSAKIVVVDNASTDDTVAVLHSAPNPVSVIRHDRNLGFARGVNAALTQAAGAFVLILNPDCVVYPEAVERMVASLEGDPDCALVGPRILNADGSLQGSARGDPNLITGLFGRSSLLTRLFPRSPWARRNVRAELVLETDGGSVPVDWVSGACMLARRDRLLAIGGFDERYFLYWEDADLCRRLRAQGSVIRYLPSASVQHVGGESSRSARRNSTRAFHRSAYTYYATHVARSAPERAFAWTLLQLRCRWKMLRS